MSYIRITEIKNKISIANKGKHRSIEEIEKIRSLLRIRREARKIKDFKLSDAIRDYVVSLGFKVQDRSDNKTILYK